MTCLLGFLLPVKCSGPEGIFPSQGSSFLEVLVPKQSTSGRQQLLVLMVSSERQSDAAEGVRVAFSKCRVHRSGGEIKILDGGIAKWEKCSLERGWSWDTEGNRRSNAGCWHLRAV